MGDILRFTKADKLETMDIMELDFAVRDCQVIQDLPTREMVREKVVKNRGGFVSITFFLNST